MIQNSISSAKVARMLGAAVFGAASMISSAQATVLTFDGYEGQADGTDYIDHGTVTSTFYLNTPDGGFGRQAGVLYNGTAPLDCLGLACPINNETTYYGALNDSYIALHSDNPTGLLQVQSFDATFIGIFSLQTGYPAIPGLIEVQGVTEDGRTIFERYQLAGPSANGFEFAHYTTSDAFAAQWFTDVFIFGYDCDYSGNCYAFQNGMAQFAIDNIALGESEVPEPTSLAIFGLGLAGLTAARRRPA